MKQPFVNATMNDRRKGKEHLTQTTQPHPLRPTAIVNPDSALPYLQRTLPVKVVKKEAPKDENSELERMKAELMAMMRAVDKKPKSVPKSKLIGMAMDTAKEDTTKDYSDVLAMLLAKK
jgi:hypothetical protein